MRTMDKNGNDLLASRASKEAKCGFIAKKMMVILVSLVAIICFLFSYVLVHYDMPCQGLNTGGVRARVFGLKESVLETRVLNSENSTAFKIDRLLGGLLTPGFDEKSCLSRYNSAFYRKPLSHTPSSSLISKLRAYEALHKRCGPGTDSYRKALNRLNSEKQYSGPSDCNYVVWISYNGLGNRILTLTSAFLYALLTDRVLLVDRGNDMADLFCEPFPDTSWLLPTGFPFMSRYRESNQKSNLTYGNMLKRKAFGKKKHTTIPSSLYLYMGHMYDDTDKLFFCDQDQSFFSNVPWLIIKTNMYFLPSLFLIPSFEQELSKLFTRKEFVFHFLGQYLFHPTNQVWGLITRFYDAYLGNSNEKIGVQIRLFQAKSDSLQYIFDQVLSCLVKEKILPEIAKQEHTLDPTKKPKTKTVVVTSLYSSYYEKLRDMYWENPTTTGEVIEFFQPSHEKTEQNKKKMHNMKAWAEIYLLSLTDKLVTSTMSTFGYVAQGLGGLRPWILYNPENQKGPNLPCHRGISLEPCFQWPPQYDCKKRSTSTLVPHVRHCEDVSWGLKLVDVEST